MNVRRKEIIYLLLLIGLCVFSRYDEEIISFLHLGEQEIPLEDAREVVYIANTSQNTVSGDNISQNDINSFELQEEPLIRVLLTNDDGSYTFSNLSFETTQNAVAMIQDTLYEWNSTLTSEMLDSYITSAADSVIWIGLNKDESWDYNASMEVNLNGDTSSYQGIFRVEKVGDSYHVVNILPMETYLNYVLISEMPSDFPMEALKAQAVCARTFAFLHLESDILEEYYADVDDTTTYQVYHATNLSDTANQAVTATKGQIMTYEGLPITAYYYSCSCGHSTTPDIWRSNTGKTFPYLTYQEYDAGELELPWYSWNSELNNLNTAQFFDKVINRCINQPEIVHVIRTSDLQMLNQEKAEQTLRTLRNSSAITNLSITARKSGNVADCLLIETPEYSIEVEGEYAIRYVLGSENATITRKDGSTTTQMMVPSGFFTMEVTKNNGAVSGYHLNGGGFGHGVGMSQYGARGLALDGKTYDAILTYYYRDVTIETIYE